ncbi:ribonuclease H-like domain-containing protein [Salibacterium aidingense]|uniref:ribonuclease H-like domain-containing protein n=1 Tax=Salibacterium aidingense TaxID=384933 RepID=UPI0003FD53C6|nr:ribonuclease H-like domain-containing protein [Salibacterium aidingense]
MKLKNKLNRMKHHMNHTSSDEKTKENIETCVQPAQDQQTVPYLEEWHQLHAAPLYLENQYVIRREVQYPLDHYHGRHALGELFPIWERWEKELTRHPLRPLERRPEDLLFFDTETTGLNSGAGNMIFLLGGAYFSRSDVHVSQYFLPGPEAEVAFYYYFLKEMKDSICHLATFNGKAFDWPQLKTRHTFVRNEVPKLPEFGHFDLLHASRRLFKHDLPSCRLSVVEAEILGFQRENDTPGYLAPMLYFDYLQEQHPGFIEGILTHNEWDVLSLITLYIELSDRVMQRGTSRQETMEIGRWFEQIKEWPQAEWCYTKAAESKKETEESPSYALGRVLKKQKRIEEAVSYFERACREENQHTADAAVELAKYMEHTKKDIEKALYYTEIAADARQYSEEINKRRQRLRNKIAKGNAG